jgi:hypothetical protein
METGFRDGKYDRTGKRVSGFGKDSKKTPAAETYPPPPSYLRCPKANFCNAMARIDDRHGNETKR